MPVGGSLGVLQRSFLKEKVEGKSLLRVCLYNKMRERRLSIKGSPRERTSCDLGEMAPSLKKALLERSKPAFLGLTHARKHASQTLILLTCPHKRQYAVRLLRCICSVYCRFLEHNSQLQTTQQTRWYVQEVNKYDRS